MDCGERDSALPLLVVLMVPMPAMQIVQLEEDELLHQLQFNAGRRKTIVGPSAPKQAEVPGKEPKAAAKVATAIPFQAFFGVKGDRNGACGRFE